MIAILGVCAVLLTVGVVFKLLLDDVDALCG
jgi:hypothetical protein